MLEYSIRTSIHTYTCTHLRCPYACTKSSLLLYNTEGYLFFPFKVFPPLVKDFSWKKMETKRATQLQLFCSCSMDRSQLIHLIGTTKACFHACLPQCKQHQPKWLRWTCRYNFYLTCNLQTNLILLPLSNVNDFKATDSLCTDDCAKSSCLHLDPGKTTTTTTTITRD